MDINQILSQVLNDYSRKNESFQRTVFHGNTADPSQLYVSFQVNTDGVSLFHES